VYVVESPGASVPQFIDVKGVVHIELEYTPTFTAVTVPDDDTDWLTLSKPVVVTVKISPTATMASIAPVESFGIAIVLFLF
jgi:hypothetical protein